VEKIALRKKAKQLRGNLGLQRTVEPFLPRRFVLPLRVDVECVRVRGTLGYVEIDVARELASAFDDRLNKIGEGSSESGIDFSRQMRMDDGRRSATDRRLFAMTHNAMRNINQSRISQSSRDEHNSDHKQNSDSTSGANSEVLRENGYDWLRICRRSGTLSLILISITAAGFLLHSK